MKQLVKIVSISALVAVLGACVSTSSGSLSGYTKSGTSNYQCGTDAVTVTYLNKDQNSIALLSVNKASPVLLANVVAASGSRYVGGVYQFWEKGNSASFTDFMKNPKQGIMCKKV